LKSKLLLNLLGLIILSGTCIAQSDTIPPDTLWTRIYQVGPDRDEMRRVVRTLDGGYALFGKYSDIDAGGEDFHMIKLEKIR